MAKRQSTQCCAVPAVAYLRRSTSRQEKSLDDQRTEIERYAASNGYRILRWFQDDGISGDATERREGFLAFHRAACNGRDFDVILVWDQDRFGRFDSMEAGYWIHPLRKAGVRLVSVTEGPINWDDFTGRVMYSLKQEGKHQFLRDLSRNVMRGQISNAQRGWLCGRMAPYGYDRMLVDEAGATGCITYYYDGDQDGVGAPRVGRDRAGHVMTDRHRGALGHQHERGRLADDLGVPHHDDLEAVQVQSGGLDEFD